MSFALKALAVVGAIVNWLLNRQQQQIGEQKQKLADDEATIKGAEHAHRVSEDIKALSDDELDRRLADSMRGNKADK